MIIFIGVLLVYLGLGVPMLLTLFGAKYSRYQTRILLSTASIGAAMVSTIWW